MFGNINHIVLLFMLLCLQVLTKTKVTRLRTKPGKISSELYTVKYPEDGWGGGYPTKFCTGRLRQEVQTLTLFYHF